MKITPASSFISFKSSISDDENVLGFDDEMSRQNREFIREHYNAYKMPYQSIYENEPRRTEYQLQALLKPLLNRSKKVDDETIMGLPVANICPIGNNSYRGATLIGCTEYLQKLKDSGIERVLDLAGYNGYQEDVEDAGLEYHGFSVFQDLWKSPMFYTLDSMMRKAKNDLRYCKKREKNINEEKFLSDREKLYKEQKQRDIDEFVKFIQTMQKGNLYVGCGHGMYRTDSPLLLNAAFNPKVDKKGFIVSEFFQIERMRNLYNNLTDKDKEKLGWTEEYEKKFLQNLEKEEDRILDWGNNYFFLG